MKKISLLLALVIMLGALLASCGGRSYKAYSVDPDYQSENTGSDSITFQDFDGNKITVKKGIQNIVCFSPEAALILRSIGSQKYIKAVDENTTNVIVSNNVITVDKIDEQNPEIVFIKESYNYTPKDDSVACVTIPDDMTVNDTKTLIKIIEKALESKKDSLADAIENQTNLAQAATNEYANKYPVFVDLGNFSTVGNGTYVSEIVSISGGYNVFGDREGYFEVTAEEIAEANPTFIFTSSDVSLYTRDRTLKTLDCVKENRVIKIEPYKLNYASQNIAECISTMFAAINAVQTGS
ncbi:MAG: ABC transporter substrate-binding protein [Clostridia bacterium]|nr:ABC transporter substrate-binding protein [Clostridia bacterium]